MGVGRWGMGSHSSLGEAGPATNSSKIPTALLVVSYQGFHRSELGAQWTVAFCNGLCS